VVRYRIRTGLRGRIVSAWEALWAGYHLAAARLFVVDDFFFPMYVIKPRARTARVQVWHAAGALKKVGYSVLTKSFGASEELVRVVPVHSNYTLALVSSSAAAPHYADAFRLPLDRFTSALGLPRTDTFFDATLRARATEALRRHYDMPSDVKLLLYAPTFRGDTVRDARYDEGLDLEVMRDRLAGGWHLLLRLHPFVRESLDIGPDLRRFVTDVSDWPDINEVMLIADLLVTDYSSAIFEFALLGRPMAFFAPDLEAYEDERGFYIDYRDGVPGPVFETTEELAAYVAGGELDISRVAGFARTWFDVADGRASIRFVDRVVLPALRGQDLRIEPAPSGDARIIAKS
jgi:CDP-glycerol glycerophosphotransferase (TagB/SpsB family)